MTFSRLLWFIVVLGAVTAAVWLNPRAAPPPHPIPLAASPHAAPSRQWFHDDSFRDLWMAPDGQPLPLSEQVDKLLATRTPADAYAAYWLIQDCVLFAKDGDITKAGPIPPGKVLPQIKGLSKEERVKEAALCKGLTERMRSSRFDMLATAARAHVEGAAFMFHAVGPYGDREALRTRPDDPQVIEWKKQSEAQLNASARQADSPSLMVLTTIYRTGGSGFEKNPQLALTYLLVLRKMANPGAFPDSMFPPDASLTPEQIAAATAEAEQMVAQFPGQSNSNVKH
jgi:hypothetical protein